MAELRDQTVLGMHNWLYFAEQEQQGHVDYKGWIKRSDTGRVMPRFKIFSLNKFKSILFAAQSIRDDATYELPWSHKTLQWLPCWYLARARDESIYCLLSGYAR